MAFPEDAKTSKSVVHRFEEVCAVDNLDKLFNRLKGPLAVSIDLLP